MAETGKRSGAGDVAGAPSRGGQTLFDRLWRAHVVLEREDEAARGVVTVKDLRRGEQFEVGRGELGAALKVELEQARVMHVE